MKIFKAYLDQITIVLVVVTVIAVLISFFSFLGHINGLVTARSEANAVPLSLPLLVRASKPYALADYQRIQAAVNSSAESAQVKMMVTEDKIIIYAATIDNEPAWNRLMSDVLAIDKNLRTVKVCGSPTGGCSGRAIYAELVGVRQQVAIEG